MCTSIALHHRLDMAFVKRFGAVSILMVAMAMSACSASGGGERQVQTKSFPHGISSVLLISGFVLVIAPVLYVAALRFVGGREAEGRTLIAVSIALVAGLATFGAAVVLWFTGR